MIDVMLDTALKREGSERESHILVGNDADLILMSMAALIDEDIYVMIDQEGSSINRMLRILRFSKLLRILRMTRGIRLIEELSEINPRAVRLGKLFMAACIFWHWFGCIYWAFEVTLHERN